MIKQINLLFGRGLFGENIFRQRSNAEASLKRILGKFQDPVKTLRICSVHGSIPFNEHLLGSIPESADFTCSRCGLRDFRSKPHFDMLFYSHLQNTGNCTANFLEDLCYCRMLLRPGASLFLIIEEKKPGHGTGWFAEKRRKEVSWLLQAGFVNTITQRLGNGFVLVGGQRPSHTF